MARKERVKLGEKVNFGGQKYEKLKKQCLKKKQLFVDTSFPPTNASLFLEEGRHADIEWKRPAELVDDPHLFVEGASPNDVTQGILGNCWFVSACSALTHNQTLIDKVIPNAEEQEWVVGKPYCGIFRFCFWRFGRWMEIVIDDLLPTREGKLLFARSKTNNEFWSALLEKAFAKLYGCYENLVGGKLSDALQDVSGGVAETINVPKYLKYRVAVTDAGLRTLKNADKGSAVLRLFDHVQTSFDNGSLIVAAIAAKTKEEIEMTLDCGLVKGHAYALTAIRTVFTNNQGKGLRERLGEFLSGKGDCERIVRLQNPWGEKEWNGPWSDGSKEWEQVSDDVKKEMNIAVDEDGEFWMPWDSFVEYFTDISMCQLFNTSYNGKPKFQEDIHLGEWTTNGVKSGAPKDRAGGCLNFTATCCSNPQYLFDVNDPCNELYFSLTQKEINEGLKRREPHTSIGMHLMRVEKNRRFRVHQPMEAAATSDYSNSRSVCLSVRNLEIGRYILMPTTFAPREQTTFLLRAYCDISIELGGKFTMSALTLDEPPKHFLSCAPSISTVTRFKIFDTVILDGQERVLFLIVYNKNEKVETSKTTEATVKPVWKDQFLFHRRDRQHTYEIELWEADAVQERRLAVARQTVLLDNDCKELSITFRSATGEFATAKLEICSYDDIYYL